ncbi:MAG: EamA family transporter [Paracoccus denitrificans]|nr:MAG: EamA family transporter [Paracoccus denitrificans]PZO85201.1 MAG: EamA family transporter [Paracoccus denitrificans]
MGSENFRASVLMVVSMVLFAFEDMFIKLMSEGLPYTQVLFIIGLLGLPMFWIALVARGGRLFTRDLLHPMVLLRNAGEVVGSLGIVAALALSPLASTSALMQALPLAIVIGAAVFLREPVGWRRWLAIGVGVGGVLLILRPGLSTFQPTSVIALVAVTGFAVRDLATRRIPAHIPSMQLAASAFLALLIAAGVAAVVLGQRFVAPSLLTCAYSIACVAVGVTAYAMIVAATRLGEASAIAPLRYVRLVTALVLAVIVFGERPDAPTLIGAAIIVGSGGYAMWREAVRRRRLLRTTTLPRGTTRRV